MVLNKFKCLLLATLLPFLLWGCSDKKGENKPARALDGLDAIYPQLSLDGSNFVAAHLTSIKIDDGGSPGYDWQMGFKDKESLKAMIDSIGPAPGVSPSPNLTDYFVNERSHMIGYVSKSNKDYILVRGHARHIDNSKKTIEISSSSPSELEKFETFNKSAAAAASVFYAPVVLKTSTESINYIRTNEGQEGVVDDFPLYYFICQRLSVSEQLECEQQNVFINKHSEEIKDELRPIYVMYEAAKAGDFSKIKIGLANDPTGDKTKRILRIFANVDGNVLLGKFLPKFHETIKEGPNKGAFRKTTRSKAEEEERSDALKKLYATSPEFRELFEKQIAFDERLKSFDIPGAVIKGAAAPVEAAAAP